MTTVRVHCAALFPSELNTMLTSRHTSRTAVRLSHLSDIHLSAPQLEWQVQDYLNKRFAGWINYRWLGRRFRFRHGERVLRSLMHDLRERRPDHVLFSGDATVLGFESELRQASNLLGVGHESMPSGMAVPGNHD